MLTVAIPKRNKLQNIIVLTPKDGNRTENAASRKGCSFCLARLPFFHEKSLALYRNKCYNALANFVEASE